MNVLPTSLDVHVEGANGGADYALSLSNTDVTVADVFDALGLPTRTSVDGRSIEYPAATRAIEVLASGSQLDAAGSRNQPEVQVADGCVEVTVVAGLAAGEIHRLDAGLYRIGGDGHDAVAGWYVEVDHPQLASTKPQPWHRHGATIEAAISHSGAVALGRPVDSEPGYGGYVHRPPRVLPAESVPPIQVIDPPDPVGAAQSLSWATLLAPIPVALMMALFFRPIFALFAAMGPLMAIGRWYESRRRHRRESDERAATIAQMLAEVAEAASNYAEAEAQRRWLTHPHVGELWRRARVRSVRIWERRPTAPGYLTVTAGVGPDQIDAETTGDKLDDELHQLLREPLWLRSVPHTVDLAANAGVGIHGDRYQALAVARSIVLQLATLHGPADMRIGVLCQDAAGPDWDWVKWLPHTDSKLTSTTAVAIAKHVAGCNNPGMGSTRGMGNASFVRPDDVGPIDLIIVDDANADVASIHRAALLANRQVRFVAVAHHPTLLPAACSSLIAVRGAVAQLATPELTGRRSQVCPVGITNASAVRWARSLTALVDPEVTEFDVGTDDDVSLLRLVNYTSSDELGQRWSRRRADQAPRAAVGVGDDGTVEIDLVNDGPHMLVAGTTGSGKSELLRTMVLALAAECPPEQLNFVLVDFKGGGAFDAVDQLPHIAGLITDLDETLVVRAINSLRAELHRREILFRELGVSDYGEAAVCSQEPLARLVIVIDEFAALATDYADLMASIIDLAARGRSLGMHLVLATQRPSGVVDQKIRANTNLRIALRVQDAFDSQDVIGVGDAAAIDRKAPGRAIFSVGGDTPITVQTAYSGALDRRSARCTVRPHWLFKPASFDNHASTGGIDSANPAALVGDPNARTELSVLLDAIAQADQSRPSEVRPLWSDPLPVSLDWIDLGARGLDGPSSDIDHGVALGLVDLPERQTQLPWRWNPDSGALALFGASAECGGKALLSLGAAFAASHGPEHAHLYVIDGDAGRTAPLADLVHTGAYIRLDERDRIERVVAFFESSLAQRRRSDGTKRAPRLVLLIDNLASVLTTFDDLAAAELVDRLAGIARDGASQRIHLAMSVRTARDLGHRLGQQVPNRLIMELADPNAYLTLGLKAREVPSLPKMRAIDLGAKSVVQLVEPPDMANWSAPPTINPDMLPAAIRTFPQTCSADDLNVAELDADGTLRIPVGIEAERLSDACLVLPAEEHALILSTNGAGRSTMLLTIVDQVARSGLDIALHCIAGARSPLASEAVAATAVSAADDIDALAASQRPTILLVDDADRLDDTMTTALQKLLSQANPNVRVVAATTPDFARSLRSWVAPLRASGTGAMVGGTVADADIFKARFTRVDGLGVLPGRGHLVVRGQAVPTQFATPVCGATATL